MQWHINVFHFSMHHRLVLTPKTIKEVEKGRKFYVLL